MTDEHRLQTKGERVGRLSLRLLSLIALSFGTVGVYYNAHAGHVFAAVAWGFLGFTIYALTRYGARQ